MSIEITVLGEQPIKRTLFGRFSKLELVEVPSGKIIAWENHDGQNTIVAGYYKKGSEWEQEGIRERMEVVPIPKSEQHDISRFLRQYGYLGPFHYW